MYAYFCNLHKNKSLISTCIKIMVIGNNLIHHCVLLISKLTCGCWLEYTNYKQSNAHVLGIKHLVRDASLRPADFTCSWGLEYTNYKQSNTHVLGICTIWYFQSFMALKIHVVDSFYSLKTRQFQIEQMIFNFLSGRALVKQKFRQL